MTEQLKTEIGNNDKGPELSIWDDVQPTNEITPIQPEESSVATEGSRLGNILRYYAYRADSAAESIDKFKDDVETRLRNTGASAMNALRKTSRGIAFATEISVGAIVSGAETASEEIDQGLETIENWGKGKIDNISELIETKADNARTRRTLRRQERRDAKQNREKERAAKAEERRQAEEAHKLEKQAMLEQKQKESAERAVEKALRAKERRERWAGRGNRLVERVHRYRAIGAAALEGARKGAAETRDELDAQRKLR